jgi:hypothetical protein
VVRLSDDAPVLSGEFGEFVGWVGLGGGFVGGGPVFGFPRDDVLARGGPFGLAMMMLRLCPAWVASWGVRRTLVAPWGVRRRRWGRIARGSGIEDGSGHDPPAASIG